MFASVLQLHRLRRLARTCFAASLASIIASCGGGGEGNGLPADFGTPFTAQSNQPLRLAGSKDPLIWALTESEWLQTFAFDWTALLARIAASANPRQSVTCELTGSVAIEWNDADRNGQVNAGDTLRLNMNACALGASATRFTGTLEVRMLAQQPASGVAARFEMPGGMRAASADVEATWSGGFESERRTAGREEVLRVTAGAADKLWVEWVLNPEQIRAVDRLESVSITRTSSQDWRGTTTTFDVLLASDVLRGKVALTTPVPVFAYYDTYPSKGAFLLTGDGRLQVTSTGGKRVTLSHDQGMGLSPVFGDYAWPDFMDGFSWVGPGPLPAQYGAAHERQRDTFGLVGPLTVPTDPSARQQTLQFTHALYGAPYLTQATLERQEPGWGSSNVAATIQVLGTTLTLSWSEQLEPGATYKVRWRSSTGADAWPGELFWSASGEEQPGYQSIIQVKLAVAATVSAQINAPTGKLLLGHQAVNLVGVGTGQGEIRYRWRQLQGAPLAFEAPDQAFTPVRLLVASAGDQPSDVEVQLEVIDSRGVADRKLIKLRAVPNPVQTTMASLRGAQGAQYFENTRAVTADSIETAYPYVSFTDSHHISTNLYFKSSENVGEVSQRAVRLFFYLPARWQGELGAFQSPVSFLRRGNGAAMNVIFESEFCQAVGSYTIHELVAPRIPTEYSVAVPITQLAIDFDFTCPGNPSAYVGSVRLNSARALR